MALRLNMRKNKTTRFRHLVTIMIRDAARESLSVVIQDVTDLVKGDTLDGEIIDTDTGKSWPQTRQQSSLGVP